MTTRGRQPGERVTEIGGFEPVDPVSHPWATGIALVLVLVAYGFVAVTLGVAVRQSDRRVDIADVEVPVVTGLTEEAARQRLEEAGLIMVVEEASNEVVAAGSVYDQEPIPGAKIETGSPVTCLVSTGPAGVVLPDTVGEQAGEAAALLRSVGLGSTEVSTYDEVVRPGEVLSSSPAAGERLAAGGVVTLSVSAGPAPRTVPAVVDEQGRPRRAFDVLADLGRTGLRPNPVTRQVDANLPEGTVVAVAPPPGSQVARGSDVALVVVGEADSSVVVPWVVGLLQDTAVAALSEAGLSPSVRTVTVPDGDPSVGRVARQGIPGDSSVPAGRVVELVVGVPAPPPTTTTTIAGSPAPTTTTIP